MKPVKIFISDRSTLPRIRLSVHSIVKLPKNSFSREASELGRAKSEVEFCQLQICSYRCAGASFYSVQQPLIREESWHLTPKSCKRQSQSPAELWRVNVVQGCTVNSQPGKAKRLGPQKTGYGGEVKVNG